MRKATTPKTAARAARKLHANKSAPAPTRRAKPAPGRRSQPGPDRQSRGALILRDSGPPAAAAPANLPPWAN
jgi:hypothetical protein